MAQYSKVTDANGTTRYKDGSKFVKADDVPENVKTALGDAAEGTVLDELGDPVNPETDSDEGSEDEPAPTSPDEDESTPDDESDADDEEQEQPTPAPAPQQTPIDPTPTPQSDEGMGFKRSKGKTLSIFSNKPHETVKNVNGIMVPLTHEEHATKTDSEILEQLRKLKKL